MTGSPNDHAGLKQGLIRLWSFLSNPVGTVETRIQAIEQRVAYTEDHLWNELQGMLKAAVRIGALAAIALVFAVLAVVHLSIGVFASVQVLLGTIVAAYVLGFFYLLLMVVPATLILLRSGALK